MNQEPITFTIAVNYATDEQIELIAKNIKATLMALLNAGEVIPFNEEGNERIHQIFKEIMGKEPSEDRSSL